ncbi:MAG: TonB-dependent receptor SusC [Candidatus Ordinivivax streblomastigis]|uniref:TonB-dependent receptor SusC n=1 Tax=Candidatus Ordinivivax streblomastigis TaxID=2540710 RepID=A0A5M8P2U0_9BACT|nr:MAG: TonB-dependent receptor SusC [Candidatus Ordinivivax streblomastigis]
MKKLFIISVMLCLSIGLFAQNTIKVEGTVIDETGIELIGVSVAVKNTPTIGAITDIDGRFRLEMPAKSTLVFSYLGYKTIEVLYTSSKEREKIALPINVNEVDEVVITGRGTQRKVSVVGAITNVEIKDLQVPATSVSNMLGGRVPGIIAVTRSGEPGNDFSDFWIRGISTFGASQSALVLIDGIEGNLNDLDPADIESFAVLKDASATAVYGVRGANGVVVVTTKRGKAGKLILNFKANSTYSYSPRMPEYANAYGYATLANEAQMVRGNSAIYSPAEVELFKTHLDPDLYPDVNWRDVILKDYVWNTQYHLNASGGGENSRYYLSLGILNNEAIFKQDKTASANNTNVDYHKYNFRANIDANLTKTTTMSLNLETVFVTQNAPGGGTDNDALWEAQANMQPTLVPVRYSTGQLPSYGTNADQMSPYVRLNYTGFAQTERYSAKTNLSVKQDLKMLTEGLSAAAMFSLSTNGYHAIIRNMNPDLYYANPRTGRNLDGSLRTERKISKTDLSAAQGSKSDRKIYFESTLNYNRVFNEDHRVTGLVHYYLEETKNSDWGIDLSGTDRTLSVIPKRYQAISGRATYSFQDTYFVEGNVGYTGSENFDKGSRYGLFPSIAAGWMPSQYQFFQDNIILINYLKFRASYGEVGNDRLNNKRFPFLTIVGNSSSGFWGGSGISETQTGAPNLQWETTKKYNFGIDTKFFREHFDLTADFFRNQTENIFQQRANIPDEAGLASILPYSNIGSMKAWGVDGTLAYIQPVNKDMNFTLRGNFTLARNKVDYWEQSGVNYPYQSYTGVPYGVRRGLIALGLFADEDDVKSSPKQTFMDNVLPGDIKYKDVNGDGKIDDDDVVPLSYSDVPRIQYGFAAEFNYKNFSVSALVEGVGEVEYFLGGTGYYPFAWESTGNVLNIVTDPANRWTPASYSGDLNTENPNARFPRLTYGENKNNNRNSTFWLTDARYVRLKNVEIDYRLPKLWMKKIGFESATLSLVGENLYVWDELKLWDPGQASSNGGVYPLQRKYTVQLYITF